MGDFQEEYDPAMDRALKYLAPRARSRREVQDVLERSGYNRPVVGRVINRLEELTILGDRAYAAEAARQGRTRGRGPEAVRRDLAARGVAPETADSVVEEVFPPEEGQHLVLEAASKKAASLAGLPPPAQLRRLSAYLARRGHDPDVVSSVCRQILGDFARSD